MEFTKKVLILFISTMFTYYFNTGSFLNFNSLLFENGKLNSNYVQIKRNEYNNSDVVARVLIDSIDLDVSLMQASDNSFYLEHDEYKNKNRLGAAFLDYRNNIDLDRKILIFGHNSKYIKTEFQKLEKFLSNDFYNDSFNRELVIETSNKISLYEIASVFVEDEDFQHMDLSFSDDEWNSHINWINNSSLYEDVILSYDDEIVIMQTCYYEPDDSYLLIVAKKIKEEYY